jgi:hypothetical protein
LTGSYVVWRGTQDPGGSGDGRGLGGPPAPGTRRRAAARSARGARRYPVTGGQECPFRTRDRRTRVSVQNQRPSPAAKLPLRKPRHASAHGVHWGQNLRDRRDRRDLRRELRLVGAQAAQQQREEAAALRPPKSAPRPLDRDLDRAVAKYHGRPELLACAPRGAEVRPRAVEHRGEHVVACERDADRERRRPPEEHRPRHRLRWGVA